MPIAKFKVFASGFPLPISYRWQLSDGSGNFTDLSNGSGYTGVNKSVLQVTVTDHAQDGLQFRAIVSTPVQQVESRVATLHVTGA